MNINAHLHSLKTRTNPVDKAEMVFIPSGEFMMGSDAVEIEEIWKALTWDTAEIQFTKSEQPAHKVQLNGFWMYNNLVTVAQYRAFCKATGTKMPDEPSYGWKDQNPIVNVNWHDAKPTANGPVDGCHPKQSGNMLPVVATPETEENKEPFLCGATRCL